MKPTRMKAGRGILLAIKTDKFKTETLTVSLPLPMEQRTGRLCNIMFNTLKRGSRKYPDIASLSRNLDDLYDANIATMVSPCGENLSAGFVLECLDGAYVPGGDDLLGGTLETLREMLYFPLFDENESFCERIVSIEKKNLCDSIRASDNDPRIHSFQLCRGKMFEGEPYGRRSSGSISDVEKVSARELTDFYSEFLTLSSPLYIYVGRRDAFEVALLIEKYFSDLGGKKASLNETVIKKAVSPMRYIEEEMAVLQGKLTMGLRADISARDSELYSGVLLNDIFGGSPSSKLFRNVREKMSLCYSCSSAYDFTKGAIFVRSGISNENKDTVTEEILKQFEAIKQGDISDYEFECSKLSIGNYYRTITDSAYSLESFYRNRFLAGIDADLDETAQRLALVSREEVVATANRFEADTCAFVRGSLKNGGESFGEDDED